MVGLEAELLLLQGLLLGFQVSLGQAQVIHELVHPTHVCLHQLAQGALTLVPSPGEIEINKDAKESPSQLPPLEQVPPPRPLASQ